MSEKRNATEQNKSHQKSKTGSLRDWLRAPTFGDLAKDRIASLQNTILLGLLAIVILYTVYVLITWNDTAWHSLVMLGLLAVFFTFALFLIRRGYLGAVSWVLVGVIFLTSIENLNTFSFNIFNIVELIVFFTLTSLFLRPRTVVITGFCTLFGLAIFIYFRPSPLITGSSYVTVPVVLIIEFALLVLASRALERSFAQVDRSTQSLTTANKDLQNLTANLEQRVDERTKALSRQALQLQAATEVSRAVSSELDANDLIEKAVNLVRDRFDLYYVGLFLLDEQRHFAVLKAGTGEASREMLAGGHKLEINDDSMIGWCIHHKEARIALLVGEEAVHFSNPLLPNTRSELALPLITQGQVIGAMTVQSEDESAFSPEDITILQTLADQLANGIEKARLYKQIQQRAIELDFAREVANSAKDEAEKARLTAEEANRSLAAQMWQTAGQAALNEKMRGEQEITTLAHNVIQHLCKYLKAYSGVI